MFRPSWIINLLIVGVFYIPGTFEQCTGEAKVTANRTRSSCTIQTVVTCNGVSTSTVSRNTDFCNLLGIPEACSGAECSRTWDLVNDICHNPQTALDSQSDNSAELFMSTNSSEINWTGLTRDLIEAIRSQSLLGALVGVLMLIIIVLSTAWVWTCCVLKKRMKKESNTVTESVQTSITPEQIRVVNNPAYVTQSDTNGHLQSKIRLSEPSTYISARKPPHNVSDITYY